LIRPSEDIHIEVRKNQGEVPEELTISLNLTIFTDPNQDPNSMLSDMT
jgi:hypothetical protein